MSFWVRRAAVFAGLAFFLFASGCTRSGPEKARALRPEERERMDAALVRVRAERPDSVIGVLIRTTDRVGADERAALDSAGLAIGSVAGRIVTGRIRADAAAALVELPFVEYMELARMIPSPPQPVIPIDTGRSDERTGLDRP